MTINSGPLKMQSVFKLGNRDTPGIYQRPTLLCVKTGCGKQFNAYPGMRRRGPGLAYCPEHNPKD